MIWKQISRTTLAGMLVMFALAALDAGAQKEARPKAGAKTKVQPNKSAPGEAPPVTSAPTEATPNATAPTEAAPADTAAGFDIKGLKFGATEAEMLAIFPGAKCSATYDQLLGDRDCIDSKSTLAAVPTSFIFRFAADRLIGITGTFPSESFLTVVGALREKYGAPTSGESERIQTPSGAIVENIRAIWSRGPETLLVQRFGSGGAISYFSMQSQAADRVFQERDRLDRARRARDL